MRKRVLLPARFDNHLRVANASERFEEAAGVAERILAAGVDLRPNLDHAAIFSDPPHLVSGPLKERGYIQGWDTRCYPSPVDGYDYINVSARLPADHRARLEGWFDYVAVVHPVDEGAQRHMLGQGHGNPFIHHLTWGIVPLERISEDDFEYTSRTIPYMVETRRRIADTIAAQPGTLIVALPQAVKDDSRYAEQLPIWMAGLAADQYQVEVMQGGGFLIQFFVLAGGRIEVALRFSTRQTFNPKSVDKISRDEISAVQPV